DVADQLIAHDEPSSREAASHTPVCYPPAWVTNSGCAEGRRWSAAVLTLPALVPQLSAHLVGERRCGALRRVLRAVAGAQRIHLTVVGEVDPLGADRKSTRLNSSHQIISY